VWASGRRQAQTSTTLATLFALAALFGCKPGDQSSVSSNSPVPRPLPTLDPGQVARGRQIYLQQCTTCHGTNAEGVAHWQQPDASGNLPPPPHDDTGHTWRHSDAQLLEITLDGMRDPFNTSPELTMPPFRDKLNQEEIVAVIAYFRSLWAEEHRRYQQEQTDRSSLPTQEAGQ
jgi:mono/diheme cytochrome c family protein